MSRSAAAAVGALTVQIDEVAPAPGGERLEANLERPVVEDPALGFCVPISGWAIAPDGSGVTVAIRQGHQTLRVARDVDRPDIARAFPELPGAERSGFSLLLDALKLPPPFEPQGGATVGGTHGEPIARVRGRRRAFEPLPTRGPAPLMVTTLGRSGSTLLLTLLSLHPEVVAFEPATYDSRPFAYEL